MARKRRSSGAGAVRQLPSGRWQARYRNEDGLLVPGPVTFDTKLDAQRWLADYADGSVDLEERRVTAPTFREYAEAWLAAGGRRGQLKPRTRDLYREHLDEFLLPAFGPLKLDRVSPTKVRAWYGSMDPEKRTQRRQVYGLLSAIMSTAVRDRLIDYQPCTVDGAHKLDRQGSTTVPTPEELDAIAWQMPERLRAAVVLSGWCSLRQGEVLELRRSDIDLEAATVSVTRAVTRTRSGEFIVGPPKSTAGIRTVTIPPHVVGMVRTHLEHHTGPGADALLFPSATDPDRHMAQSTLHKSFTKARAAAGRPDLRWHDLRHGGATIAAQNGATLAELMARLGHTSARAALIYQHATSARDASLAQRMSETRPRLSLVKGEESRRRSATGN